MQPTEFARTRLRAETGNVSAQLAMGKAYFTGDGVPKDEAEGLRWFRRAAEKGEPQSARILGLAYEAGLAGLAQDETKAAYWFRKGAEEGDAMAQSKLAQMYETGRGGLPKDGTEALRWYRKLADRGVAAAQNKVGDMYEFGRANLPKDDVQALAWYRKAADQGDVSALGNAARICLTSSNADIRSPMAGLDYARRAVELKKDDPELFSILARAYYVEGQFENAVQTQLQAIGLAPSYKKAEYQGPLNEYQHALERQKGGGKKSNWSWPAR
jgi:hypothetical protein